MGLVVALIGPWGSGKSSLMNMTVERLVDESSCIRLDFSPWYFSSTDDLLATFFVEIGSQLEARGGEFKQISRAWNNYGKYLAVFKTFPVVGGGFEVLAEVAKVGNGGDQVGGMRRRRDEVSEALSRLPNPIVVVLDDIDRLESREIRDIFRLVRLTGSFPNIIYLLAFDRARIERALEEDGFDGRTYLEKIVQLPIDVPIPSMEGFSEKITDAIDDALIDVIASPPFDKERWLSVFPKIVRPQIRNMRDVKRYQAALRGTVRNLGSEVNLVDILALEAIRVFRPEIYNYIASAPDAFVQPSPGIFNPALEREYKHTIEIFVNHDDDGSSVRNEIIELLFPIALRHIKENASRPDLQDMVGLNRVGYATFVALYLDRTDSFSLNNYRRARLVCALEPNRKEYERFLANIEESELKPLIEALELIEGQIPDDAFVPLIATLGSSISRSPGRPQGFVSRGANDMITGMVGRRVCKAENAETAAAQLSIILAGISNLDFRFELLRRLKDDAEDGNCRLSMEGWLGIKEDARRTLKVMNVAWLIDMDRLGWYLAMLNEGSEDMTWVIERDPSGKMAEKLLRTSLETRMRTIRGMTDDVIERIGDKQLLLRIFENEDAATRFVERFSGSMDPEVAYARDQNRLALGLEPVIQ